MSKQREPPKLRANGTVDPADLHALALHHFEEWGGSQTQLAREIGKSQASVSAALKDPNGGSPDRETRYDAMRVRIVEHLTGYSLTPFYRVTK